MKHSKSFIEEELARERRLSAKSSSKKVEGVVGTNAVNRRKMITSSLAAQRLGLVMTPNEIRQSLGYPTISDEPQFVITDDNLDDALDI